MGRVVKKKMFQSVICLQDHKNYVYNVNDNPDFSKDDFARIKCFPLNEEGEPDLAKEVEIYRKYLVVGYLDDVPLNTKVKVRSILK